MIRGLGAPGESPRRRGCGGRRERSFGARESTREHPAPLDPEITTEGRSRRLRERASSASLPRPPAQDLRAAARREPGGGRRRSGRRGPSCRAPTGVASPRTSTPAGHRSRRRTRPAQPGAGLAPVRSSLRGRARAPRSVTARPALRRGAGRRSRPGREARPGPRGGGCLARSGSAGAMRRPTSLRRRGRSGVRAARLAASARSRRAERHEGGSGRARSSSGAPGRKR